VLPSGVKEKYRILISASETLVKDEVHLGYLALKNL